MYLVYEIVDGLVFEIGRTTELDRLNIEVQNNTVDLLEPINRTYGVVEIEQ